MELILKLYLYREIRIINLHKTICNSLLWEVSNLPVNYVTVFPRPTKLDDVCFWMMRLNSVKWANFKSLAALHSKNAPASDYHSSVVNLTAFHHICVRGAATCPCFSQLFTGEKGLCTETLRNNCAESCQLCHKVVSTPNLCHLLELRRPVHSQDRFCNEPT